MWADKLLTVIMEQRYSKEWPEKFKAAFEDLFSGTNGRYRKRLSGK
jgi:hypothetical protein